ncbi:MAG: hypothetical protein U0575_03345 [Phycisphaerales bacterium]
MNRSFAAFVALSIALPAPSIHAAFVTTSYTGASGGAWSNALNWSNGIPDDGLGGNTYHAVIGPGLAVNMLSTIDVTQITLGLGAAIIVANDVDPTLNGGTITNDGVILMASTGNSTVLGLNAPNVVLSGSGSLEGFNQNALILSVNAVRRLTNSAGHTIRGSISIGFDNTLLTNDGVIEATDPDGISIDLGGSESSNFSAGILRGTNGATLTIVGSGIDATGGTIRADGGNVDINSSTIVGGTYMDANGGLLRLVGGSSSLVNPTIDTGSTLHAVNDNDPVVLGTVTNNGTFRLESTGNTTALGLNSTEVVFTGIGQLEGLNQNAVILSINAVRRLTNSVGHTILGSMSIGNNNTLLTNNGVIEATDPDGITIDLGGSEGSNFNTGVLGAMPGATLTIASTGLDNTGGTIIADGGTVDVNSSTIVNGFFTQANGGLLRTVGGASTLINPEIATGATLHVVNDNDPVLIGTVTNNGTISIESAGNATAIGLNSPDVFLEGDGTVEGLDQNAIFVSVGAVRRLTNAATHTMRGSMSIGSNNTLLTNNGLIEATDPDGITIDLGGSEGSNFNTGTLRAGPGATLTIAGTGLDNTGGTIVGDGGTVDITSSTIVNGVLDSTGAGQLRLVGGSSTLGNVTIDAGATLHIVNDNDPVFINTITNNGLIASDAAGNSTVIQLNTPVVTLAGDGVLQGSNTQNNVIQSTGAVRRLVNGLGHAIRGSWALGTNNTNLTNQGAILADTDGGLTIDVLSDFQNEGLLAVTLAGSLAIQPGLFVQSGTFQVDSGLAATRNGGPIDQTAGVTSVNGALTVTGGSNFNLADGILTGGGTVTAALVNNTGGTIAPGSGPGQMTIIGSTTFGANATFATEIGGPQGVGPNDLLFTTGVATLAGTINVTRAGGYAPLSTEEFTVLVAGSRVGTFTSVVSCDPVEVTYTANSVKVRFPTSTGIVGDLNGDGIVNGLDLGILLGFWGPCPGTCCPGDLNGDGLVDGADFGVLLANWT